MNDNGIETTHDEQLLLETGKSAEQALPCGLIDENDLYIRELQTKLNEMKKERKQAECDANLLGNRLNLLKEEEAKVLLS